MEQVGGGGGGGGGGGSQGWGGGLEINNPSSLIHQHLREKTNLLYNIEIRDNYSNA